MEKVINLLRELDLEVNVDDVKCAYSRELIYEKLIEDARVKHHRSVRHFRPSSIRETHKNYKLDRRIQLNLKELKNFRKYILHRGMRYSSKARNKHN